jgi:hypothetical protein
MLELILLRFFDWWTVEALLAMTWAGLFELWGIMAYKVIGHSYSSKRPP